MHKYLTTFALAAIIITNPLSVLAGYSSPDAESRLFTSGTICSATATEPSINIVSPNGGEDYVSGQAIEVRWTTCNAAAGDKVTIILQSNQTPYGAELVTVANTGLATITLPTSLGGGQAPVIAGQYYKMHLELGGNAMGRVAASDDSDSLFTIGVKHQIDNTSATSAAVPAKSVKYRNTNTNKITGATSYVLGQGSVNTNSFGSFFVQTSTTADMSDIKTNAFNIRANNGSAKLQKLPITLRVTGGMLDTVEPSVKSIIKSASLYANGIKISQEAVLGNCVGATKSCVLMFGKQYTLNYLLPADQDVELSVKIDVNDTENSQNSLIDFDKDDMVRVLVTSNNINNTVVQNTNGGTVDYQSDDMLPGFIQIFK